LLKHIEGHNEKRGKRMAKILLVDDAAFMRMMIKDTLTKNGYTDLYEAGDGAQAVEKFEEVNPDLVIMDITMPNMDGLEALKTIIAKHPEAKIVMCSAMGQETMVIDAIKLGAKDFIVKPFKPDRILKTVSAILPQG
jgi:two-component system chemotaxis response regulator CheY